MTLERNLVRDAADGDPGEAGDRAVEIHRETSDKFGCAYRIVYAPCYSTGPYFVEQAPQALDGSVREEEFTGLGGGVGTPSGDFKTEDGARGFLRALADLDAEDEQAFWDLLDAWEGR